jgi:hypothetical protein
MTAPPDFASPERIADISLFQSVIDGTPPVDMLSPELADLLETAYNRQGGEAGADAEIDSLFEAAVNAYAACMLEATKDLAYQGGPEGVLFDLEVIVDEETRHTPDGAGHVK